MSDICFGPKCSRLGNRRGLCSAHYNQRYWYKIPLRPLRGRGETIETSEGYLQIKKPLHPNSKKSGYILEHRFIMSEKLGRPLHSDETVHHINGDRKDNSPTNLELWSGPHGSGVRVEDKIKDSIDFLTRHGYVITTGIRSCE